MKTYTITVNGKSYQVSVSEAVAEDSKPVHVASQEVVAPKVEAKPLVSDLSSGQRGGIQVQASVPGKIISIVGKVGDVVAKGDTILIQEAMKMELPVVATENGKIVSIDVSVGSQVSTGDIIATLE